MSGRTVVAPNSGGHALVPIGARAQELDACCGTPRSQMDAAAVPQILITIAARFGRISWKHSSFAYALILKDVGVLPQTLYLMTTRTGLGGCAIGVSNIDLFAKLTGIVHVEGPVGQFALGRGSTVHGVFTGGNDASSYGVLAANAIARREPLGTLYLATAFFDLLLVTDVLTSAAVSARPDGMDRPSGGRAHVCKKESTAMPRAYWKGYLRLSLVTCPIELFPATSQAEKTHFHQINTSTGHRLRQQMVDEQTGRVVELEHKGRGYEFGKGRYVSIEEDELKAVEIESTHTVDITGFVPKADIDKRYLDRPYYISPQGKVGVDAFAVIRDAMKDKERVALAKIVIAHREHVIALEPLGKGLLGTTLRYDYEVRDEKDYFSGVPSPRVSKDMVNLAAHILATKETNFDPRKFKDEYEEGAQEARRRKPRGIPSWNPRPPSAPTMSLT